MKNSNILFDLVATQPQGNTQRHGGGKYGEIVFKRIVERKLPVIAIYNSKLWLNPVINKIIKENEIVLIDLNEHKLNDIISNCNISMIYSPLPTVLGLDRFKLCKVIGTTHGVRSLELPLDPFFWKYKTSLKEKIKFLLCKLLPIIGYYKSKKYGDILKSNSMYSFVTVSLHSKYALKCYYPQFKDLDIPVFYSPSTSINKKMHSKYIESFFLMVSANRWEKNILRAIIALDYLFSLGYLSDKTVKIAGCRDSTCFKYKIKNKERFHFLGYVDDDDLEQLYHDAYCLIYPSLNEGFGYPPLEAMHWGTPVIASSFTSIPEICQNAAIYFNPYSIKEIMNRILLLTDEMNYDLYKERSLIQYKFITDKQDKDLDGLIDYIYNYSNI